MSENQTAAVETESEEITLETVLSELIATAFGTSETVTAYKIATIINGAFKVLEVEKQIPPQMMYNYDRNGMIVRGSKSKKQFNKDEVTTFVTKYVSKYL